MESAFMFQYTVTFKVKLTEILNWIQCCIPLSVSVVRVLFQGGEFETLNSKGGKQTKQYNRKNPEKAL